MRKIKKIFSVWLAILLMLCMSVNLVGCNKAGPITNGNYGVVYSIPEEPFPDNCFMRTESDVRKSYGWIIDGNTAEEWVSGICQYKAKIVERDGKIYFEGYQWRDFVDIVFGRYQKHGSNTVYEVEVYGTSEQGNTLYIVVIPVLK